MSNQTTPPRELGESTRPDIVSDEVDPRDVILARLVAHRALDVDRTVSSAIAPLAEHMTATPLDPDESVNEYSVDAGTVAALRTAVDELEEFTEMVAAPIAEETHAWEDGTGRRAPQEVLDWMARDSGDPSE